MVYLILLIMLLFIFKIIFSRRTPKKIAYKNTVAPKLQFHTKNDSLELFGHTITNSLFYTCNTYSDLPFAVDTSAVPAFGTEPADSLGYCPNYNILNKAQQGFYIQWLSEGKPFTDDLGYAYIYYYGLEYRALIEKQDLKDVLFEVIDLVTTFKQLKYAYPFIPYLMLSIHNFSAEETNILVKFFKANKQKYTHNPAYPAIMKKLSPTGDYAVKFSLPQVLDKKLYSKLKDRKKELLAYYFENAQEQFDAAKLYAAKLRTYRYDMAVKLHGSKYTAQHFAEYDALAPSPKMQTMLESACKILSEIKTIKKFDNSDGALSEIEKLTYLPVQLRKKIKPALPIDFEDKTITDIETLTGKLGLKLGEKLTLQQSYFIVNACEVLGYEIEPNAAVTRKSYKKDSEVIVYKSKYPQATLSQNYRAALLFTDLGLKIAPEDNEILPVEISSLNTYIQKEFALTPAEQYRLQQHEVLTLHTKNVGSTNTIKKLINMSADTGRKAIAKFILSIAKADGIIKNEEFKALQKLFKQLGFSEADFNASLTELTRNAAKSIIIEKETPKKGKADKASAPDYTAPVELKIDSERLQEIKINTSEIHNVLEEIFTEEQKEHEEQAEAAPKESTAEPENQLQDIINALIEKDSWKREELLKIIQNTGKMLASIIDDVNACTEENYGDFLIEEDNGIYLVNADVAMLIKNEE